MVPFFTYRIVALIIAVASSNAQTASPVQQCGVAASASERITGGQRVRAFEYPWLVSITGNKLNSFTNYFQGGVLIDRQWVLTEATLAMNSTSVEVTLGSEYYGESRDYASRQQIIQAESISYVGPIGLIKLRQPAAITASVRPICLPAASMCSATTISAFSSVYDTCSSSSDEVVSAGWGALSTNASNSAAYSNKMNVTLLARPSCSGSTLQLANDEICGFGARNGQGLCWDDFGNPLMCVKGGRHYVLGVATLITTRDCERGFAVYGRVCSYIDWIRSKIAAQDVTISRRTTTMPTPTPDLRTCGVRSATPRILGGGFASPSEFPWLAHIEVITANWTNLCSGALIADRWVLTDYWCIVHSPINRTFVTLGRSDLSATGDRSTEQVIAGKAFRWNSFVPETSSSVPLRSLALLELETSYRYSANVRPLCLPEADDSNSFSSSSSVYDGCTSAELAGWGRDNASSYYVSERLKKINMTLYSRDACEIAHRKVLSAEHMCADSPRANSGACQPDRVLICYKNNVAYALGIANRIMEPCGIYATVFTRVSSFVTWIKSIIASNTTDASLTATSPTPTTTRIITTMPALRTCGVRSAMSPRIFGGEIAANNEFPWLAQIEVMSANSTWICSGALIDDRWILTNYNCIGYSEILRIFVALGLVDTSTNSNRSAGQYLVGKTFHWEAFTPETRTNVAVGNIALLELETSYRYSESVRPLCLPDQDISNVYLSTSSIYDGCTTAEVAGWGRTETSGNFASTLLKKTNMTLYSRETCETIHRKLLSGEHLCANSSLRGSGPCGGDQVLICYKNQVAYALGILNRNLSPCGGFASVFTKVSSFTTWIRSIIASNSEGRLQTSPTNERSFLQSPPRSEWNWSLMHNAAFNGDVEWVRRLASTNVSLLRQPSNAKGWLKLPIHIAIEAGQIQVVKFMLTQDRTLISAGDNQTNTPLHYAAMSGRQSIVDYLIDELGVSIELRTELYGRTPLHLASFGQLAMVRYLIEQKGANVTAIDSIGGSQPIHLAAEFGHLQIVEWLVARYPDSVCARNRTSSANLNRRHVSIDGRVCDGPAGFSRNYCQVYGLYII